MLFYTELVLDEEDIQQNAGLQVDKNEERPDHREEDIPTTTIQLMTYY